jgi:hypothetical protein
MDQGCKELIWRKPFPPNPSIPEIVVQTNNLLAKALFFGRWVYIRYAYTLMLKNKVYNVIPVVASIIIVVVIIISSSNGGGA